MSSLRVIAPDVRRVVLRVYGGPSWSSPCAVDEVSVPSNYVGELLEILRKIRALGTGIWLEVGAGPSVMHALGPEWIAASRELDKWMPEHGDMEVAVPDAGGTDPRAPIHVRIYSRDEPW
ncbi:MAG: hypothetical protein ACP5G6_05215 [Conexivisphaera sp.]|jgi:hypothetical protein